jgi:hypothetical protein
MDLDPVETSRFGVLRARAVGLGDARDFLGFERTGVTYGCCGRTKLTLPFGAIALGETGSAPLW